MQMWAGWTAKPLERKSHQLRSARTSTLQSNQKNLAVKITDGHRRKRKEENSTMGADGVILSDQISNLAISQDQASFRGTTRLNPEIQCRIFQISQDTIRLIPHRYSYGNTLWLK